MSVIDYLQFELYYIFRKGGASMPEAILPEYFPVWKTIRLGQFKGPAGYYRELKRGKYEINRTADSALARSEIAPSGTVAELVLISQTMVRMNKDVPYCRFYGQVTALGYQPCNGEVAAALRLDFDEQGHDSVSLGMIPINDFGGHDYIRGCILSLRYNQGDLFLCSSYCPWGYAYPCEQKFAFVRSIKTAEN
jgi:hypothetical protein